MFSHRLSTIDHPLRPQLPADTAPRILASQQLLPVLLRLPPRRQFPERRNGQHHTIVEIRLEIEMDCAHQPVAEVLQVADQCLLALDLPLQLVQLASGQPVPAGLHTRELLALQANLRLDIADQGLEEGVLIEKLR